MFSLYIHCPKGESEADRVWGPFPSGASREAVPDGHHAGRVLQGGAHLRGAERKSYPGATVPLEGDEKDFLQRTYLSLSSKIKRRVPPFFFFFR